MFLIRDWNQPEEYNYGFEGGKKFIKSFLKVKDFHTAELKQVREFLKNTFEDISGFLMPYPGKTVARNSSFDGRWSEIDEDFVETMKELFPILLAPANLTVKTLNGMPLKAFELSVYIKQYVDLFKSENLPEAKSIYESTVDNQLQILISKSVELYLQLISGSQDKIINKAEVDKVHKVGKLLALRYFNEQKKFGTPEEAMIYQKELEEKLEKALDDWKPVKLEFLQKIEKEQAKADVQKNLALDAKNREVIAKQEATHVDHKYVQLQKQIAQALNDTHESRREAAILKQKFAQLEVARQNALLREQEARQHFQKVQKQLETIEAQLVIEKEKAAQRFNEQVGEIRKRDSVLKYLGGVVVGFFKSFWFV